MNPLRRGIKVSIVPDSGSGQESALARQAPAGARPKRRTIPIGELNFGIAKLGPFELPLPTWGARSVVKLIGFLVLLLALAGTGIWLVVLRGPLDAAQAALRMARYDVAQDALRNVPDWLAVWPSVKAMQSKAALGADFYAKEPDWEILGRDLRRLRGKSPHDTDLMVLAAYYSMRREGDYAKLRELAEGATEGDERNAEAWFMLGLDSDLAGDTADAERFYRKAVAVAPDSPQYRDNLAHVLLLGGRFDLAIEEYRKISRFPLARIEEALVHWAKGEMDSAKDAQRDALKMLDDAVLMDDYYNRRAWLFTLSSIGVRLAALDDKRCYAHVEEAASRRLGGDTAAEFPPSVCRDPPTEIRKLVAHDLCRYVDAHWPDLRQSAGELRTALKQPAMCPAPSLPPKRSADIVS